MKQKQRGAFVSMVEKAAKGTSKYKNVRTGGYASKREYAYAVDLLMRKQATNGDVLDWCEQVSVKLPGGIVYRVDFLVFKRDGTWELVEVKGAVTREWQMKMALMKEARPGLYARLSVVK